MRKQDEEDDEKYHSLNEDQWKRIKQAYDLLKSVQSEVGKDFYTLEWSLANTPTDILRNGLKREFIARYCERSEITLEFYDSMFVALECECDDETCEGWATIDSDKTSIKTHLFGIGSVSLEELQERDEERRRRVKAWS